MPVSARQYMIEMVKIAGAIECDAIERLVDELAALRGRLWIVGLGGSAANASHAAADLRRLCSMDAFAMMESVPELTARANDDGWGTIFSGQLASEGTPVDALLVLSVGGGTKEVSVPIVRAIDMARSVGMSVFGIVGRDGGYTAKHGDCVVVIPTVSQERVTPHTEAWQMVIVHLLVSHPKLQRKSTKW